FFSSRRRHTRFSRDWSQTCALPISGHGPHRDESPPFPPIRQRTRHLPHRRGSGGVGGTGPETRRVLPLRPNVTSGYRGGTGGPRPTGLGVRRPGSSPRIRPRPLDEGQLVLGIAVPPSEV